MNTLRLSADDIDQLRKRVDNWYAAGDSQVLRGMEAAVLVGFVSAILERLDEPAVSDRATA